MKKKPYLSIKEQISLLEKRGLIIKNKTRLTLYLKNYNYSSVINGYNDFFMHNFSRSSNKYINSSSENIIDLFNFDRNLGGTILSNLLNIERKISTLISEKIIEFSIDKKIENAKYGEILTWGEENIKFIFDRFDWNNNDILNLKNIFIKFCDGKKQLEKYKDKNYENAPIWVLSLYWSFGSAIKIYQYLNKTIKNEISKELIKEFKPEIDNTNLTFVMIMLNDLRNIICHNNVLYKLNYKNNVKEIISFIKSKIDPNFKHASIRIIDILKIIEYIIPKSKIKKIFIDKFNETTLNKFDKNIAKEIKRYLHF